MSGPVDPSVLKLQANHRSVRAWEGSTTQLVTRQHYQASTRDWQVDERVLELVDIAGFMYIHRLLGGGLELDRALITALVQRWRQETHTFHLTVGEASITLPDTAVNWDCPLMDMQLLDMVRESGQLASSTSFPVTLSTYSSLLSGLPGSTERQSGNMP